MSSPLDSQIGGDHYRRMNPQPIEVIMNSRLGFVEGNIFKYICRFPHKGSSEEDLKKIGHYAHFLSTNPITNGSLNRLTIERFCHNNSLTGCQINLLLSFVEYLARPNQETIKNITEEVTLALKQLKLKN